MQINKQKVLNVISEKVHGKEFYSNEMIDELFILIDKVYKNLKIEECKTDEEKIIKINNFLRDKCRVKKDYFKFYDNNLPLSKDFYIYRTAYSALKFTESTCIAYTEAMRVLLAGLNIDSKTVVCKLPGENKLMSHYSSIIRYNKNGKIVYKTFDPERENYTIRHNLDFKKYVDETIFISPTDYFCNHKLDNGGCGLLVNDYLKTNPIKFKGNLSAVALYNSRSK